MCFSADVRALPDHPLTSDLLKQQVRWLQQSPTRERHRVLVSQQRALEPAYARGGCGHHEHQSA